MNTTTNTATASRESWSFLATYYAWEARKINLSGWFKPHGTNPLTGLPWAPRDYAMAARLERAAYIAKAREAYAIARTFGPTPLP